MHGGQWLPHLRLKPDLRICMFTPLLSANVLSSYQHQQQPAQQERSKLREPTELALSDGGVDTYAVSAAFWLGAKIPVRSSLADTIHMHVSKRPAYYSVINKLLTIGWGHSTPVIEMTRTRAGTNALLLVGALREGVSPYIAAQSLSEVLAVYGLGPEAMPNIDVLQHVTNVVERAIEASAIEFRALGDDDAIKKTRIHSRRLRYEGAPDSLARAINQLVFTSKKGQEHYMILEMRGTWLPAFASHMLGMSVQLHYGDKLIWASGGDNGTTALQIGSPPQHGSSMTSSLGHLTIVTCPVPDFGKIPMPITHSIESALESVLLKWPQIDLDLAVAIHAAIRRLSFNLFRVMVSFDHSFHNRVSTPIETFDGIMALKAVLDILQVREDKGGRTSRAEQHENGTTDHLLSPDGVTLSEIFSMTDTALGLAEIDSSNLMKLLGLCVWHQKHLRSATDTDAFYDNGYNWENCICNQVGAVIYCFAVATTGGKCTDGKSDDGMERDLYQT
ncbi:hypothetical protein CPLU01_13073 [Colletotrichum plurivorum]|uniref:Uncharacterized protein n=1 Tax=Colletotrichum plurivorum TaxID=2175906 RepID=A0A8H6JUY8_9PEZI|nr:hypothetical protein CPLU01_13073 [Colletotrichum plurivorum]